MTDRTTTYDPTTNREPRAGERSSQTGAGASAYGSEGNERERARRAAEEIKTAAREAAVSTAGAVRNRLSGELDYRKYKSRQRLGRVATALRQASAEVGSEDEAFARYIQRAADRADQFGDYLDRKDVNEVLHDARQLARRRPEIFAGSLFVAGLMLGRFLRSSAPNGGNGQDRERASGSYPYSGAGSFSGGATTGSYQGSAASSMPKPGGGIVP